MADQKEAPDDVFFHLVISFFVLFTQVGFTLLEAGAQRTKNTTNVMIKNTVNLFLTILIYWAVGYAFAWGSSSNAFIGHSNFFFTKVPASSYTFCVFHLALAATANIIVSGALAERTKFWAYSVLTVFMTGFIYPLVSHWVWHNDGWLKTSVGLGTPYKDMAGSSVISVVAGTMALVGAIFLGPRSGRFEQGKPISIGSHIVPMCMLGSFFIFLGYLAVIAGSTLHISQPGDVTAVSVAIFSALLGACGGAITTFVLRRTCAKCFGHHLPLLNVLFGATAGIISVCADGHAYYPYGALIVGVFGGLTYISWAIVLIHSGVDDPLDTIAVHLGSGSWGVLAAVLFDKEDGVLFMGDKQSFKSLGWNLLGLVVIFLWSLLLSVMVFGLLKLVKCARLSEEDELRGLDMVVHREPAYPIRLDSKHMLGQFTRPTSPKHTGQTRQSPESQQDSGAAGLSARSSPACEQAEIATPNVSLEDEVTRL